MPNRLFNILVPITTAGRDKWAIAKAIELANNFSCCIHLVYVVNKRLLPLLPIERNRITPYESRKDLLRAQKKLELLKYRYKDQLCGAASIEISVLEGNPKKELSAYIQKYDMDLVVVGLSRFNLIHRVISSIGITRFARKVNIPVLAVRSSGLVSHFKKIVLPLHEDISIRRIKLATMLARTFRSTVYFVSLREQADKQPSLLNAALEVVQSLSTIPVQCFLLEGKNLAKSTLDFSKKINADLILVNPVKEYRLPGLWNKLTNKLLSYGSSIPVVTVAGQAEE
ncbi:MAG TPA: universal stress protein [Chitinophagaceae bacterium]